MIVRGVDSDKDRVIIQQFKKEFMDGRLVDEKYQSVLNAAIDYRLGDEEDLNKYRDEIKELTKRVEELYNSLNSRLEFDLDRITSGEMKIEEKDNKEGDNVEVDNTEGKVMDLRGVKCPINFVKAKLFIEPLPTGTVVDYYLDDGEPIKNVPGSLTAEGYEILLKEQQADGYYLLRVKKG